MTSRYTSRLIYRPIPQYSLHPAPTSAPRRGPDQISKPCRNAHHPTPSNNPRLNAHLRPAQSVQSSVSSTVVIFLVATTISLLSYSELRRLREADQDPDGLLKDTENPHNEGRAASMAGEPLPGRPDNLTAEEEQKLKEFWLALQAVCGVSPLTNDTDGVSNAGNTQTDAKEKDAEKQKVKKRLGLFSRSKDESGKSPSLTMEGEDKYGQAKDYVKVLEDSKPEQLREAIWSMVKHDNPDALLLRFLRARKWHVQNALIMLVATMHWRQEEQHVDDDIIYRGELGALEDSKSSNADTKKAGDDFMMQMRLGKSFVHGQDKEGRPLCFVRVRLHHGSDQSVKSIERYTVYTIETSRFLLKSPVDTAAIVFDMTDFSLANMDYTPVKFMIKVFEANYPESLGVVLVHKSPWIFQSIWKIIKGWLDPVVAAKIHFTKDLKELEEYVPKKQIPKELGGDDPWEYTYVEPTSGENALLKDEETRKRLMDERAKLIKEYETVTQKWVHDPKQEGALKERADLTEKLRQGYWELDPYVRARSLYDRTGLIKEGGQVDYYPEQLYGKPEDKVAAVTNNGPIPAGAHHAADDVD